jgi:hypothetical protein
MASEVLLILPPDEAEALSRFYKRKGLRPSARLMARRRAHQSDSRRRLFIHHFVIKHSVKR